jgi:hypothetical protein
MSEQRDPLDQLLASLPREAPPERDLWQGIHAEIAKTPIVTDAAPVVHFSSTRWFQMAAAALLVLATSVTTYVITRESLQEDAALQMAQYEPMPAPNLNAMPVNFGPDALGAEYLQARADLDQVFEQRIKSLPPSARAKLERNLADLRQAANEISATLAEHPSNPLLQDLLMSTYQRELQLLADVSDVTTPNAARTDL